MPIEIVSFGFKYGSPNITSDSGDKVIDVRTRLTKNPYHNPKLRYLRGDHPDVIADIERNPSMEDAYIHIRKQAIKCSGVFYVGCTGGHHRSVYVANRLAKDLGVRVRHKDYNKK